MSARLARPAGTMLTVPTFLEATNAHATRILALMQPANASMVRDRGGGSGEEGAVHVWLVA